VASNRQLLKESRTIRRWPERVVLAVGTAEAGQPDKIRVLWTMFANWLASCAEPVLNEKGLRLVIEEGASHSESAWARRFLRR